MLFWTFVSYIIIFKPFCFKKNLYRYLSYKAKSTHLLTDHFSSWENICFVKLIIQ